ncbi:MAG TPA: polysaccharide biosynthesis tyrosine autokinase [Longimicrobiales bacterium]|nr:polysaccharide biosynthesis tyrosine autokinase [Longimicrobiales bacterium]
MLPSPNGRPRDEAQLRTVWNFIQRNRLLAFGIPVLVVVATALFVAAATPVYEATATVRIDEQQSNIAVLDALKTLANGSKIETEMEVLQSRTLAEDVVADLSLALQVTAPRRVPRSALFAEVHVSPDAPKGEYVLRRRGETFAVATKEGTPLGEARAGGVLRVPGATLTLAKGAATQAEIDLAVTPFEAAVYRFRKTVSVSRPNRDADIVVVRYEGTDPELVRAVPNAMAQMFIARRQRVQSAQALSTVRFLDEQLDTLRWQLVGAEDSLKRFREQARVVSPEAEAKAQVGRLVELQAQRDMVEAERAALASLLGEISAAPAGAEGAPSPLRRLIAFPTLYKNPATSELLRSLSEVENERGELLVKRKPADPDVQQLTARVHELEQQLGSIASTYLEGLTAQVASLNVVLGRFGGELDRIPATEVAYARLERQAKVLEDIYTMLQTRLKEAQIAAAVEDPSVRVVDPAIAPLKPIRPNVPLSLGLALVVGLVLGAGAAVAREHMDTRVRSREDLQLATSGIPVLGMIPRIAEARVLDGSRWRRRAPALPAATDGFHARLVAIRDPRSPISEAYRSLRTNITFARPERAPKTLVFTSPTPGDGKSTSTSNLAATLAQQGLRCIVLDADLRRGVLHEVLNAPREPGLSNVLVGACRVEDARSTVAVDGIGRFDFLSSGTLPPNPAELLGSPRMRALLDRLEEEYDAVLLDAPPLNLVTDAAVLGTNVDGVVVVARAGVTERGALHYALEQLTAVRAPVLGTVLNDIDARSGRYYGAYYGGYHYGRST